MLKLTTVDQDFFKGEPVIRILSEDKKGLTKIAADDQINNFIASMDRRPDRTYLHLLALGAGEFFGSNRNGDFFPESSLIAYHHTFVTSPGWIYRHHQNRNPEIAMGQIIFSFYNPRMRRVEVIAWVDKIKAKDYLDKIERGEFPSTSMATKTPYDVCSICSNKAHTRSQYCSHLNNDLGRLLPDGRKVMAINSAPLAFFELSFVFKPADITSGLLQKIAFEVGTQGSAEAAEIAGLSKAATQKLSSLIKEIEGDVLNFGSLQKVLSRIKDPDNDVINFLVHYELHHVLHALAELGISPSVAFFAKLIGQKMAGEGVEGIGELVQSLLRHDDAKNLDITKMEDSGINQFGKSNILSSLTPFVKSASLFPEQVMGRILNPDGSVLSRQSGLGFIGNGPLIKDEDKVDYEAYQKLKEQTEAHVSEETPSPNLLSTLFQVAGAAVAAKWLLNEMIQRRMQEIRSQQQTSQSPIKIVLVKTAEDASTTQKLSKASLLMALRGL